MGAAASLKNGNVEANPNGVSKECVTFLRLFQPFADYSADNAAASQKLRIEAWKNYTRKRNSTRRMPLAKFDSWSYDLLIDREKGLGTDEGRDLYRRFRTQRSYNAAAAMGPALVAPAVALAATVMPA